MDSTVTSLAPRSPISGTGRILAVASGKGGVGKTWLAITLGHSLARAGHRVLLFDGDLGLANVDVQLGLSGAGDLGGVIAGRLTLDKAIFNHEGGFDVLAGCSGSGALSTTDPGTLEQLLAALRKIARRYDIVLLDLGAGLDRSVRRMATFADALLVVVTDEPTSLTDAYAVLKLYSHDLGSDRREARVVVNLASSRAAGERTFSTLQRASLTFLGRAPSCAGIIRRDERVRDAIRRQTLLLARHPTCAAAEDVDAISACLL